MITVEKRHQNPWSRVAKDDHVTIYRRRLRYLNRSRKRSENERISAYPKMHPEITPSNAAVNDTYQDNLPRGTSVTWNEVPTNNESCDKSEMSIVNSSIEDDGLSRTGERFDNEIRHKWNRAQF